MIGRRGMMDIYRFYRDNSDNPVDQATFRAIYSGMNKMTIDKVVEGFDVQLSNDNTLGTLSIRGRETKMQLDEHGNIKGQAVDWKKTLELWKRNPEAKEKKERIFYLNSHTGGIRYRYHWSKKRTNLRNKRLYSILMCRANKKRVKLSLDTGKEYLIVD